MATPDAEGSAKTQPQKRSFGNPKTPPAHPASGTPSGAETAQRIGG
jgi:hypothetical protein